MVGFQIFLEFPPQNLGKMISILTIASFSNGWEKTHQLDNHKQDGLVTWPAEVLVRLHLFLVDLGSQQTSNCTSGTGRPGRRGLNHEMPMVLKWRLGHRGKTEGESLDPQFLGDDF